MTRLLHPCAFGGSAADWVWVLESPDDDLMSLSCKSSSEINLDFFLLCQYKKGDSRFSLFLPHCSSTRVQSELIKQEKMSTLRSCQFHQVSWFFFRVGDASLLRWCFFSLLLFKHGNKIQCLLSWFSKLLHDVRWSETEITAFLWSWNTVLIPQVFLQSPARRRLTLSRDLSLLSWLPTNSSLTITWKQQMKMMTKRR